MDEQTEKQKNKNQQTDSQQLEQQQIELQLKTRLVYYFPWLSIITSLGLIGFIVIASNQRLNNLYHIPDYLMSHQWMVIYFVLLAIIILLDIRQFSRKKKQTKNQFDQVKQHLSFIWESKKKQQQRANTFSGHTDKLKTFISDKLLEYIEYDEKFLHFKGIAAEVRHNGVISYDKVLTALNKAIEQQHFLSLYEEQSQQEPTEQTIDSLAKYQTAIDAMRYLWDLLDLSTADNMALHIGNQQIECEEHYYQLYLDADKKLDSTQSIPISPTFHPQSAALMTLALLVDEKEIRNLISLSKINEAVLQETFQFKNDLFNIELVDTPELLGNLNHIVLLLENLIKNAQFFSQKVQFKQKSDRLIIRLSPNDDHAQYSIYNRGPHIEQDNKEEIFKLGYSTRRNKQHHGKGLGLFFASQIVKGYQGAIHVENIHNKLVVTSVRYQLASGDERTFDVELSEVGARLLTRRTGEQDWQQELKIESDIPITRIQLSDSAGEIDKPLEAINSEDSLHWIVRDQQLRAIWQLNISPFKKRHKVTLRPLDINGVNFLIKLPTAHSRLNEQEADLN